MKIKHRFMFREETIGKKTRNKIERISKIENETNFSNYFILPKKEHNFFHKKLQPV